MPVTPLPFGTQLIGQVERTLGAILERLLDGTGVTAPGWVALATALRTTPSALLDAADAVSTALKTDPAAARRTLDELAALGLVAADGATLTVTPAGRTLHADVRTRVDAVTERLWGDLPEDDARTAAAVLGTVLDRATVELQVLSTAG